MSWNDYYWYSFIPIQNSQSFAKTQTLDAGIIRTYAKEKQYKISNITFAILPFSHKNTLT